MIAVGPPVAADAGGAAPASCPAAVQPGPELAQDSAKQAEILRQSGHRAEAFDAYAKAYALLPEPIQRELDAEKVRMALKADRNSIEQIEAALRFFRSAFGDQKELDELINRSCDHVTIIHPAARRAVGTHFPVCWQPQYCRLKIVFWQGGSQVSETDRVDSGYAVDLAGLVHPGAVELKIENPDSEGPDKAVASRWVTVQKPD